MSSRSVISRIPCEPAASASSDWKVAPMALNLIFAGRTRGWLCASSWPARSSSRLSLRSEEHTSELQSQSNLVCRLLLEKKKTKTTHIYLSDHSYVHIRLG